MLLCTGPNGRLLFLFSEHLRENLPPKQAELPLAGTHLCASCFDCVHGHGAWMPAGSVQALVASRSCRSPGASGSRRSRCS